MAVTLIALWMLTPDVLCLLPGVTLTVDEHECCERMGGQCGRVPMPDVHKCCQTVTPSNAVITAKADPYPGLQAAPVASINTAADLERLFSSSSHALHSLTTISPPSAFHSSPDVLRI